MKVSILGTNGFLSNAIARYANEHDWHLDMYGLEVPSKVTYDHYYHVNLLDGNLDCTTMLDSDMIVYAIGAGIQSNLNEGVELIYLLNVTLPIAICNQLKALEYRGVVVTFGSYFELGETTLQTPATEDDILMANAPMPNDYAVSKRLLTRFVNSYKHDYTHWHFILPTIYGPGENPKRLIPYTINAIRNNEELHFTSGEQVRQYLYVGDVPEYIIRSYLKQLPSGIYNLGGDIVISIQELVSIICTKQNHKLDYGSFGKQKKLDSKMQYLALNDSLITNCLNYNDKTQFKNVIELY